MPGSAPIAGDTLASQKLEARRVFVAQNRLGESCIFILRIVAL
jgi:hypothetical protein